MIPLREATEAGVLVANLPGVNARSVAEYVMFAMLALSRRFRRIDRDLRTDGWLVARAHADLTQELAGRTVGIIGPGNVGRTVQAVAQAGFGMRVVAASRAAGTAPDGFVQRPLDDLLAEADFVVLSCPLTAETRGLMNRDRIGRMKLPAPRWTCSAPSRCRPIFIFRAGLRDPHAASGRYHRTEYAAHGARGRGRGTTRAGRQTSSQSGEP